MQLVAVAAGDVGENGDNVFFLRRFIDNHLFFQRVQLAHQQRVGDVYRLCAADIIHRPLDDVFTVIGHIQHAAVGQYGAHSGNRRWLNIRILYAQFSQRLFDSRVIRMGRTGQRRRQQRKHQ